MARIREGRQIQQHERQLERAPGPVGWLIGLGDRIREGQLLVGTPSFASDGVYSLTPHREVREPERLGHVWIAQSRDSCAHSSRGVAANLDVGVGRWLMTLQTTLGVR